MKEIIIATGQIPEKYEVIDTIFAIDSSTAGFMSGVDPNKAFQAVKKQLKNSCQTLGGDAVIFCQFEYRNALADGFLGKKQALEIFAYGTAVRII